LQIKEINKSRNQEQSMSKVPEVVNVKVGFIRPKYNNLAEWMADPDNLYIARAGIVFINGERFPKQNSPYANLNKIGADGTRDEVLAKYRDWITDEIACGRLSLEPLRHVKRLGCWCTPERCHGDILIDLLNGE
jgi:hypothetical protein